MRYFRYISFNLLLILSAYHLQAISYNSHGQTGLIRLPTAEVHEDQSVFFTFNKSSYTKIGSITVTPFKWMEASYFYYRPDDLLWGSTKGLYLDKGFNLKFSYKPDSIIFPRIAIGLDDFAGTGAFTREYITSTYNFNNFKLTSGIGWGKYAGDSTFTNPLRIIDKSFETRARSSSGYSLGGNLSYDLWFKGPAVLFGGIEIEVPKVKNLSFKLESNPFNYFDYSCCGEGLSDESQILRKKDSDINFGFSYKYKEYGNIDFSYIKGNTWNIGFSIGVSAKKPIRKKNKFSPKIKNTSFSQNKKNEFYWDLLDNLNKNKLYLQTASIEKELLSLTIDSEEHINPIISASRAAYIAKEVSSFNNINISRVSVGHLSRGAEINNISFKSSDLDLEKRLPNILIKRNSDVTDPDLNNRLGHEFKPLINYPLITNNISPDIRTHVGSPERFLFTGFGLKLSTEIQINRNIVINSSINKSFVDNFNEKVSTPNSNLPYVRTQVVEYLQGSSDDFYLANLDIERIWSPYNNIWAKLNLGYLEMMYGGFAGELVYKPFKYNIAIGAEYNSVKKREFDQKFLFRDYKVTTKHLNVAYYQPSTNILAKWSYGSYLAGDSGYTLDLSRRMPSGWSAGFFFSRTNVSAQDFGEGSFDKGFYFNIPTNIFSRRYSKNVPGIKLRTMTRDGGQKLELRNRLIDSFYGSTLVEINENWENYLD